MPGIVLQRHTIAHDRPRQQVPLILNAYAGALRAAGGKHLVARIARWILQITVECNRGQRVDCILSRVHPVQPDPEIGNLRFWYHKT